MARFSSKHLVLRFLRLLHAQGSIVTLRPPAIAFLPVEGRMVHTEAQREEREARRELGETEQVKDRVPQVSLLGSVLDLSRSPLCYPIPFSGTSGVSSL